MGNYYIANTSVVDQDQGVSVDWVLVRHTDQIYLRDQKIPLQHPDQGTVAGFVFGGHVPFSYTYPPAASGPFGDAYHAYNDAVQTLSLKSIEKFNFTTPAPSTEVGELAYTSPVNANSGATGWASINSSTHGYAAFGQDILHGTVPQPYPNGYNRNYRGFSTDSIEKFPFAISSGTATNILDPLPNYGSSIHRTGLSSPEYGYLAGGYSLYDTTSPDQVAFGWGTSFTNNAMHKFAFATATPISLYGETVWASNPHSDPTLTASQRAGSVGYSTSTAGYLAGGKSSVYGYPSVWPTAYRTTPVFSNHYKSIEKINWADDSYTVDVGELEYVMNDASLIPSTFPGGLDNPQVNYTSPNYDNANPPYVGVSPTTPNNWDPKYHRITQFDMMNGGVTGPTHGYTLNLSVSGYSTLPSGAVNESSQVAVAYGISRFQKFPFSITSGQSAVLYDAQFLTPFNSYAIRGFQANPIPSPDYFWEPTDPQTVVNPTLYRGDYPQYQYNTTIVYSNLVGHQTPTDGYLSGSVQPGMLQAPGLPYSPYTGNEINKFPFSSDNFITADVGDLVENRSNHGGVSY